MMARIPERYMHLTRWALAIGWLILILSMFYDPISAQLTEPNHLFAASSTNGCFQFQGTCQPLVPYAMGARIFWGMVVPLCIITLLIFGHETWRRICPLSFLSQIPRALGWQRKQVIHENSWLGRNALYFQFGLLFIGLNLRLLLVNSDRLLLGIFLLLTIATAITIGFLYDGKTWCNYFCPMAPVHRIYSEPGGLLGSQAHTAPPKSITQSMCRTVDKTGQEKSACVACKLSCMDIDAEAAYWDGIRQPDRKLLYYAYLGLVIGFYLYFGLYTGNWRFLSAGVWNETNQLAALMKPGFYIAGQAIAIPKLIAVPLTLTLFSGMTYAIGLLLEKRYKCQNQRSARPLSPEQVQSRCFAIATFLAFNLLFFLGVRPTLGYFPAWAQNLISWGAIVASSLWLVKTWQHSAQRYHRERDANLMRRQLGKLNIDLSQFLEGRSLDDLRPDELYTLAKVLPSFTQDYRLQIYRGVLRDALEQRSATPASSLKIFQTLRQKLSLSEETHWDLLDQLQSEAPQLFPLPRWQSHDDATIRRAPTQTDTDATLFNPLASRPGASSNPPRNLSDPTLVKPQSEHPNTAPKTPPDSTSDDATIQRNPEL
jgi:hypothetical protein